MSGLSLRIDHAVVVTNDLEALIAEWSGRGFVVERGGVHPRGSVNALVSFADGSYIELIAFPKPLPEVRWWRVLRDAGPGWIDLALLPSDLDAALERTRAAGLGYGPPQEGGRERPDGATLHWRTARPETTDLPFFCADVTARELRVPAPPRHPNGVTGIAAVSIAVTDLAASTKRWSALTGRPASRIGAIPGLDVTAAFLDLGRTRITLLAPERPGHGPIARHLDRRGEGLFGLAFATLGSETSAARVPDRSEAAAEIEGRAP